jgi:hypothetical protein
VLETYYSNDSSDYQAPIIWGLAVETDEAGDVVDFAATVEDAERVLVTCSLLNGDGRGSLQSFDLDQFSADSSLWSGTVTIDIDCGGAKEYFVQAIDSAGNVAVASKEGFHEIGDLEPDLVLPIQTERTVHITLEYDPGDGDGYKPIVLEGDDSIEVDLLYPGSIVDESTTCRTYTNSGTCQVTITSDQPGISVLTITVTTNGLTRRFTYVTEWWAGSVTIDNQVESGPFTDLPDKNCFTLNSTDGFNDRICNSSNFNWELLPAGTYTLSQQMEPAPVKHELLDPITFVIDSGHRDFHITVVNKLLPGKLELAKQDQFGALWGDDKPEITYRIFNCGSDPDCSTLENQVTTLVIPTFGNPASIELPEGRYLVREIPPSGYGVAPDADQRVEIHAGQQSSILFRNGPAQGCSPGYWKNHLDQWTELVPDDSFESIFNVGTPFGDMTLLEAINLGGGGYEKLARHGMSALLNAKHASIYFSYGSHQVIDLVQSGFAEDANPGEPEATWLADANTVGCPLP